MTSNLSHIGKIQEPTPLDGPSIGYYSSRNIQFLLAKDYNNFLGVPYSLLVGHGLVCPYDHSALSH